jgi:steroid delta-isomerase-like uncharacterized protein
MSEANKEVLRRWFDEVWNKGRAEAIDEMFAEHGRAHGLGDDDSVIGPTEFKQFYATFRGAFPDMVVVIDDMVAEGDKVAVRCSVRGKHTGDSLGFAATQTPVGFTGMVIVRIENGKIVEAWNNFDFMAMNRQLGVI